jgi:hypothetical protein
MSYRNYQTRCVMKKGLFLTALILTAAIAVLGAYAQQDADSQSTETKQIDSSSAKPDTTAADKIIAYYFHGDRRCATCLKLEAYSAEALQTGFKKELSDSVLVWRVVNYDEKENKHYIDDYNLYTKALILSRVSGGKEVGWKNLDKIWQLVGNKDKFIEYVQQETREFMKTDSQ